MQYVVQNLLSGLKKHGKISEELLDKTLEAVARYDVYAKKYKLNTSKTVGVMVFDDDESFIDFLNIFVLDKFMLHDISPVIGYVKTAYKPSTDEFDYVDIPSILVVRSWDHLAYAVSEFLDGSDYEPTYMGCTIDAGMQLLSIVVREFSFSRLFVKWILRKPTLGKTVTEQLIRKGFAEKIKE